MLIRPRRSDIKAILDYTGRVVLALGIAMLVPLILSLSLGEWKPAVDFLVGALVCFAYGSVTRITCRNHENASWSVGMASVALSWLAAMIFGAIPLFLSGHFGSFLDACFDSMSGLATTGLTVIQDLDHLAVGTNLWRHLIMFLGGQGIMLAVLTFFAAGGARAMEIYIGEAREERIFPNVIRTARFIWAVSFVYLLIGTFMLWMVAMKAGMPAGKGLFHSICIFMAGYDTGGYTPMSQGIIYYHSLWFELATIILMFLGMLNFGLHFAVWRGNLRELYRNVETRTLFVTITITTILVAAGLSRLGVYPGSEALFRKGFYQLISSHSGTGFMTVYGQQFVTRWGSLAFFAIIIAMALGGAACSTSGGIKSIRVNVSAKTIGHDITSLLSPWKAVVTHKYHHIRDVIITDRLVHGVLLITLCYIIAYLAGALIVSMYKYPLSMALFESTSACANVGMTTGLTSPAMPAVVKTVFIVQMWAGRLEFMSVFLLFGYIVAFVRGK